MNVAFDDVFGILCRAQNDPAVVRVSQRLGTARRRVVQHLVYMDYFDCGLSFLFDEMLCLSSVFFFSEGRHKDHCGYAGSFPGKLRFGASRGEVRSVFNQLTAYSDGGGEMFGIPIEPWDEFAYEGHLIHVEYSDQDQTVAMVTISCGEGRVEFHSAKSTNTLGLMSVLRRWFKPKNPMGIRRHS